MKRSQGVLEGKGNHIVDDFGVLDSLEGFPSLCILPATIESNPRRIEQSGQASEEGVAAIEDIDTATKVGAGFRLAGLCLIEFIDLVLQSETLDFYGDIKDG
jgi:hypothetical protein